MYFPTSAAKQLSSAPSLPQLSAVHVICLSPSPRKSLFCTLTTNSISVWRTRPSAVLAHLSRAPTSLAEHGENLSVSWAPDGTRIVIQTTDSYLLLITVQFNPEVIPYASAPLAPAAQRHFLPGPGEALPLQSITLHLQGVIRIEGQLLSVSPRKQYILFSTKIPPSVQRIPWPALRTDDANDLGGAGKRWLDYETWTVDEQELPWLVNANVLVSKIEYSRTTDTETWITSDGRAYFVQLSDAVIPGSSSDIVTVERQSREDLDTPGLNTTRDLTEQRASQDSASVHRFQWQGTCIHDVEPPRWVQKQRQIDPKSSKGRELTYDEPRRAVSVAINAKFSLIATGTYSGSVELADFPLLESSTPKPQILEVPNQYGRTQSGPVHVLEWSSDGYVLAVGWQYGWAIWSVGGRCLAWGFGVEDKVDEERFQDAFMYGVLDLFWGPGNFELVVLARSAPNIVEGQLFIIPFAKSAATCQHSPDNTRYAFLQMDDRVLIYRGADQPDMSVINPESDVWQHIKIPLKYLAANWPMQYSSLSIDGRLVAVAGRRGLIHYSTTSGRWKLFADEMQEQAFFVRGGLVWFHHVLIAAVEVSRSYQIRLYSRDLELSNQNVLHREVISFPVVILSLVDNSLLVYTADNTLLHFLIVPTADTIKLHLCGSISFSGIIAAPTSVRGLSWMIPTAQKQLGDPVDDMAVATVLMMVGGKLVLLRPRKSADREVKYDMQILAERIEFCWIHLRGIGTLENSLWGYDGRGIRVWLNALALESQPPDDTSDARESVKESVNIRLDFYPLSVLMDKGIIIGVEHESVTRMTLPFVLFRHVTSSHLFLHHILRFQLEAGQVSEAVTYASHYRDLVFFAHALEILLHTVVESEASLDANVVYATTSNVEGILPTVVDFLDHFDAALDVVVGCARKTEMARWPRLFEVVGNPHTLFETCLQLDLLKTAGSYLLVLHNLEQLEEGSGDAVRLLRKAMQAQDWQLCQELLRFLHSIDDSGVALRDALSQIKLIEITNGSM